MIKDELLVKSNKLIEARMKFTSNEYKLISYIASKIKKGDKKFRTFDISIIELNKYCFGTDSKKIYSYMKNQYADALATKNITILKDAGKVIYNWFTIVDTSKKGIVRICFSPELEIFLLNTENNFTSYKLSNILDFKSFYSIRMYELLKQYERIGKREFLLEDLKYILGLEENQYKISRDFRKFIIEKALKEINEKTDIKVSFNETKVGRVTKGIAFYIETQKNKEKNKEILEIKDKIENVLQIDVNNNILEKTIIKYDLKKETIYYYLDNWNAFNYKNMNNKIGFLLKCAIERIELPNVQVGINKPIQSTNFDQRHYDDEFFDSLYDNLK